MFFKEQPKKWPNLVEKGLISVCTSGNHTSKCPNYEVTGVNRLRSASVLGNSTCSWVLVSTDLRNV